MEGFTVGNANRFLDAGNIREYKTTFADKGHPSSQTQGEKSFADTLKEAVGSVNQMQNAADIATQKLATGKTDNIPEVMIATEKADIAFKLMVQVRNKIIEAYQDVMKMQV